METMLERVREASRAALGSPLATPACFAVLALAVSGALAVPGAADFKAVKLAYAACPPSAEAARALPGGAQAWAGQSEGEKASSPKAAAEDATAEDVAGGASEAEAEAPEADRTLSAASVGELLQMPALPAGCESVALTCVLRSMGFDLGLTDIVDGYLDIDPTRSDYVTGFGGDPRTGGGALPPAMVTAANRYLAAQGEQGIEARDVTGTSFDGLLAQVSEGRPVLVWTTMYMADPAFTGYERDGWRWYSNEHCVVLYGVDGEDVLVSDPLEGLVRRDAAQFQRLYEACGSMAMALYTR